MSLNPCPRASCSQLRAYLLVSSVALSCALGSAPSIAGPLVIEETAKLTSPDPAYDFPLTPAVGGNSIIVGGFRFAPNPEFPNQFEWAAFLFERDTSGAWRFVRKMAELRNCDDPACDQGLAIAMNSNVAAMISLQLRVFERTSAGWVSVPAAGGASNGGISVHSGMILVGHNSGTCSDGVLFQKQAGTWVFTRAFIRVLPPDVEDRCGDIDASGGQVDISGSRVIVSNGFEIPDAAVQIWNRNADGSWPGPPTAIVPLPPGTEFSSGPGAVVAIEGNEALANSNSRLNGPHLLRYDGTWSVAGGLQRPDRAMFFPATGLELLNGFAAVGAGYASSVPQGSNGAVAIFRRNASGGFDYVAQLVASDGFLFGDVAISGRRIVASGREIRDFPPGAAVVYVFDLPADFSQPALIQDDFEDRNVAEWTQIPGSVVSVPFNGLSAFYRQSSVAGDAGSLRTGVDMRNQGIEAEVVGRTFASGAGDRWFGLTVRQTDPDNLYFLTVRNNNVISLRKRVNGAVTVLQSVEMPVLLNRRYKLRLEAIGSRINAYVDGQLRINVTDRSLRSGAAGLRMFRTAADYDNVVISPNAHTTAFADDFGEESSVHEPWWFPRLGTWSEVAEANNVVFSQSALSTDGRITTDIDLDDQVVQARARADQFAPGDRWFGLVSRLQDDQNFYYLTVRSSNSVSLRKMVNGTIFVLDTASFPVSVGTWYTLRLEAVGSSLRGYVNGRPLVEAIDDDFTAGTYGLATSRTAASFDNVRAMQP